MSPKILVVGLASTMLALPAAAQTAEQTAEWERWYEARQNVANAEDILAGEVHNRFNILGNVTDLILSPSGNQIQYILYEVPYPYSAFGAEDGFVAWDNVTLERSTTGINVRIDDEAAARLPEELTLTRGQADHRLVSNIIGEDVGFSDETEREIEDILFNPSTGAVTHYVVQMDEESLFATDSRRVPASMVSISEQGEISISSPADYDYELWAF